MKIIKVAELFAGVGGFRLGFEKASNHLYRYKIVWSNQFEPSSNIQHASKIYIKNFGEKQHSNKDITKIDVNSIPSHDLLVGGFPCQDYSVTKILSYSYGINGEKGKLWWQIHKIIKAKKSKYILLENVDRLLTSPAPQRGKDFTIILKSLVNLGYEIEWRVINAADYGMPQKRKRIFIYACLHKRNQSAENIIFKRGVFAKAFPIKIDNSKNMEINLNKSIKSSINWHNTGCTINKKAFSYQTQTNYNGIKTVLKDILQKDSEIPHHFYVKENKYLKKWKYLKDGKKEKRYNRQGQEFNYTEGSMPFPDNINKPSRTIITSEGGISPSRSKHIIETKKGLRRLTPIELERLNLFPDNYTEGVSDTKRGFLMGNSVVVGIIEQVGHILGIDYID